MSLRATSYSVLWAGLALVLAVTAARAEDVERPSILKKVDFEQRLNNQIPLDLVFRDETGQSVPLRNYFGKKPVILSLAYYECPMLCTLVLNGLNGALRVINFDLGKDFEVVTVSFNPNETADLAAKKKASYLKEYSRPGAEAGWHFLTGDEPSIKALTEAVGFKYAWDPAAKQYAHAAGIMVLTPEGRLSRYFYGVEFSPRDLGLGLVEAADGKIGSPVEKLLLFCFHYNPATGKYSASAVNLVRLGGVLTVLFLGSFIILMLRRERHGRATVGGLPPHGGTPHGVAPRV